MSSKNSYTFPNTFVVYHPDTLVSSVDSPKILVSDLDPHTLAKHNLWILKTKWKVLTGRIYWCHEKIGIQCELWTLVSVTYVSKIGFISFAMNVI